MKRIAEFVLFFGLCLIVAILVLEVGGFWAGIGSVIVGAAIAAIGAWKHGRTDEPGMVIFGYIWCGLGFVCGALGLWWCMPLTILLIPTYCFVMDYLSW